MITIDQENCVACGICGIVCPRHVLVTVDSNGHESTNVEPDREGLCMGCGQCAAVCPNNALSVEGLPAEGYLPLPPVKLNYDDLTALFNSRRSVRRYQDQPIERKVLLKIAHAAGTAPAGAGRAATGLVIIDQPDQLAEFSGHVFKEYKGLSGAMTNPIGRLIVRRRAGLLNYRMLENFVMPGMRWYIRWKNGGEGDEILRDCRALFLFHTDQFEPMGQANCALAAWHGILAAHTLGVGTCMNDLIPPVCNRSNEIKDMLGLDAGQKVMASVTLGYPKYKYKRTIPRELASLRFLERFEGAGQSKSEKGSAQTRLRSY